MRSVACVLLVACASAAPPPPVDPAARCPEPAQAAPPAAPETPAVANVGEVVLDGTPEVPAAVRAKIARYQETRSASVEAIAGDGRSLLIATRFAETAQIHEVRMPMGDRRQLTFAEEPARAAELLPDGSVLYMGDVGGAENFQIYRLDRSAGRTTLLTDGRSRHAEYAVSRDGSRIAYNGNARNGRDMDLYLGDGRSASAGALLLERQGHWSPMEFSRDGRSLLVQEVVSINDLRLHVVDLETKVVRAITPASPASSNRSATFGTSPEVVYVTSDREGEFVELYEVSLAGPSPAWRPLTRRIPWNVEEVALSADGRTLAFTTNEDGYSVLSLLDARTRRSQSVQTPRGVIGGLQFAKGAPVLAFTGSGFTRTGDAYTYDLRTRRVARWTESEVGGLDASRFVEPSLAMTRSFDDRMVPGYLYKPAAGGPFPVVIHIHGGPEGQARPRFDPLLQYLAVESGIAILVPNVRGSDGYGKSALLADNGRLREDSVKDIGAFLDWIVAEPDLDESRVAVFGGSYGGYMVLASLVHFGERIRAGVDVVGISNFVTFLENTSPYRQDLRRVEYGDERDPGMREHLQRISPVTNVDRIRSALFVAHGANDPRVPASEAEAIVQAVRQGGREVWYMLARNEGHGFQKKENRDAFLELAVAFLERQLGPRP